MPNKSRFSLFMDHIFPPFITAMHFSNLTADNCENPLLAKKIPFTTLSKRMILELKGKIYLGIYMQKKKSPYLFLACRLIFHTEYGFGVHNHVFIRVQGDSLKKHNLPPSALTCSLFTWGRNVRASPLGFPRVGAI